MIPEAGPLAIPPRCGRGERETDEFLWRYVRSMRSAIRRRGESNGHAFREVEFGESRIKRTETIGWRSIGTQPTIAFVGWKHRHEEFDHRNSG